MNDKYTRDTGQIYLNGIQALVRLLFMQQRSDRQNGLHTGGFVAGYRGSPLSVLDKELWKAQDLLAEHNIRFWPAVNEDLAATAVWGSQMTGSHGESTVAGVYGMWFGKGAGFDRSGDAFRHANTNGVNPFGGVLAVVGDDHAQKSSTHPYYSEPTFADLLMPVLCPSGVEEIIVYGLLGWALSRRSGCWVGLKVIPEDLDCSTIIDISELEKKLNIPPQLVSGRDELHFRWPDPWHEGENRWLTHKLPAIFDFVSATPVDRVIVQADTPQLGIITCGKSYLDLQQAFLDIGSSLQEAVKFGVSVFKVGMTWPLEPRAIADFSLRHREVLVIEEKRPTIEDQLRVLLYGRDGAPPISGKKDLRGDRQFPWSGDLSPELIAEVLINKVPSLTATKTFAERMQTLKYSKLNLARLRQDVDYAKRVPYFCSGCPHNSSTKVPEGSNAIAGVGCHYMASYMNRRTTTYSQMGGEGATWIGQSPFSKTRHVFVNLGEGTYFHSGSLAIRACVAAGVNITYKILFNDAVAMTGGQPVDGKLSVPQLTQQLYAEGVRHIYLLSDIPQKYKKESNLVPGVKIDHRKNLDKVQRLLREIPGVSVLVYEQTCAAEKRRRRKRGTLHDPPLRAFINEEVCEGCGDCSAQSNCLSVVPVATPLGRKRQIDQFNCNKDLSCLQGFCPSFVTIAGGQLRRDKAVQFPVLPDLQDPRLPSLETPFNIFIAGIGGTGVVTIGALLGVAAYLEGKACSVLDQIGMAQKGGSVVTHLRMAGHRDLIPARKVPEASADLVLGCDLVVTCENQTLKTIARDKTQLIVNTHETITSEFLDNPDVEQPTGKMVGTLRKLVKAERFFAEDFTSLVNAVFRKDIATNLFILGIAYQRGAIPVSAGSIEKAIEINGVDIEENIEIFRIGRYAATNYAELCQTATPGQVLSPEEKIAWYAGRLATYQDEGYAKRYRDFVAKVTCAERGLANGGNALTLAVADVLYKLMAYKDEYEVARLHSNENFLKKIADTFTGDYRLNFHLAPPVLSGGKPQKRTFGPWVMHLFKVLARLKRLRGTPFDIFGYSRERKQERQLIQEYREMVEKLLRRLDSGNYANAVELAVLPKMVRGFGHVKAKNIRAYELRKQQLWEEFTKTHDPIPVRPKVS